MVLLIISLKYTHIYKSLIQEIVSLYLLKHLTPTLTILALNTNYSRGLMRNHRDREDEPLKIESRRSKIHR